MILPLIEAVTAEAEYVWVREGEIPLLDVWYSKRESANKQLNIWFWMSFEFLLDIWLGGFTSSSLIMKIYQALAGFAQ